MDLLIASGIEAIKNIPNAEPEDPLLVIFWNEEVLATLNNRHPNPKDLILNELLVAGGRILEPQLESLVLFREPSLLITGQQTLKETLPWAFVAGGRTAAILNVPQGVPLARTSIIFKTERVTPDVVEFEFFSA
jgi:hypothetical protein